MKFVSVRDLRIRPGEVWRWLQDERELVLTSNGKPFAVLTEVDERRLEEHLLALRRARAQKAVSRIRRVARERGLDDLEQRAVDALIGEARTVNGGQSKPSSSRTRPAAGKGRKIAGSR